MILGFFQIFNPTLVFSNVHLTFVMYVSSLRNPLTIILEYACFPHGGLIIISNKQDYVPSPETVDFIDLRLVLNPKKTLVK